MIKKQKELIIFLDKKRMLSQSYYFPIIIFVSLCALIFLAEIDSRSLFLIYFLVQMAKIIISLLIAMLLFGLIYAFFIMDENDPIAHLSRDGIWAKYYGFIPWDNISSVNSYFPIPSPDAEAVGIQVKNTDIVSRQSSWIGKFNIFIYNLTGHPTVTLTNTTALNKDILDFAQMCMDERKKL